MRYPGFFGSSAKTAAYTADNEELINLLRLRNPPNAPTPFTYINTWGFEQISSVPEGPIRGSCIAGSLTFFVAGYRFYEWDGVTATARGTLVADANPATLCWNGPAGDQLFLTSGDVGYCYNLTTHVLTTVLASGATMGAFLDGYFLALDATTGTLQISDLLDGLTWDPAQIAQRSDAADPWTAMTVIHAEIWLQGNRTGCVWFDAGAFPFPFEMIPGARMEQGIAAPFSATRDVAPLLWVSANAQGARVVLMAQGYGGIPVSDDALAWALNRYTVVSDATSMNFQIAGHTIYALTFPTEDVTWYYDVGENVWGKNLYWNTLTSTYEALRVRTHVLTAAGVHFMGDRSSGAFYRMGMDIYHDVDGARIRCLRRPPVLRAPDNVRFITDELQVIMDVGVGVLGASDTDPDVNPQAMLRTSRDAGQTWGSERWMPIGKIGEYETRVFWQNGGQARNRQDEFVFMAKCPIRVVDATLKIRIGTS